AEIAPLDPVPGELAVPLRGRLEMAGAEVAPAERLGRRHGGLRWGLIDWLDLLLAMQPAKTWQGTWWGIARGAHGDSVGSGSGQRVGSCREQKQDHCTSSAPTPWRSC